MSQQLIEVHPSCTHDCVDLVTLFSLQPVLVHPMALL